LWKKRESSELETVYGDKIYTSRKNVQFISDLGAYTAIEMTESLLSG